MPEDGAMKDPDEPIWMHAPLTLPTNEKALRELHWKFALLYPIVAEPPQEPPV